MSLFFSPLFQEACPFGSIATRRKLGCSLSVLLHRRCHEQRQRATAAAARAPFLCGSCGSPSDARHGVAIFTTNIRNHGGVVVGPADDTDAVDYFLAEKSTEKKPIQAAQVRALWKTMKGELKSLHWLEDMLAKRYAPETFQYPLLSHYHPSLPFPSPLYPPNSLLGMRTTIPFVSTLWNRRRRILQRVD